MESPKNPLTFRVQAENYTLDTTPLGIDLFRNTFFKSYPERHHRFELFPDQWHLGLGLNIQPGQVTVYSRGKPMPVAGNFAVFLPSFSILEWDIGPGDFVVDTIKSSVSLPGAPTRPILFKPPTTSLPLTFEQASSWLSNVHSFIPLDRVQTPPAIARRAKTFLDAHFTEDIAITALATRMKTSRSVLSRAFQESFGMSPVEYRNSLRVFYSLRLISEQQCKALVAGQLSGFSDLSNFNRHFKKLVEHVPSAFRKRSEPF